MFLLDIQQQVTGEVSQMQSDLTDSSLEYGKENSESPKPSKKSVKTPFNVVDSGLEIEYGQSIRNPSNQLVLYSSGASDPDHDAIALVDHTEDDTPFFNRYLAPNSSHYVLPSVGAFTVQCAACFKWRLIPTKEKYEELRENILQEPFMCERAREWRPDIMCEDPEDISPDGSRLWAIDKPNIAKPPPSWERLLRIRSEGSTKFADVYYAAPSGKKLRSMVEIERYLMEHPEYIQQGVNLSQFSFQIPRPLQENYVRKRPARLIRSCDDAVLVSPNPLEPEEVTPLSWEAPPRHRDLQIGEPDELAPYEGAPVHPPPDGLMRSPAKKLRIRRPVPQPTLDRPVCDQPHAELEDAG